MIPEIRNQFSRPAAAALLCLLVALLAETVGNAVARAADPPAAIDFSHQIVPVLRENCLECHGGDAAEGGLSINTRQLLVDAGVVVPLNSAESPLVERITSDDVDFRMPPPDHEPLAAAEIDLLRRWIDGGLPWQAGFTFAVTGYEPPLEPRRPELPPPTDGRDNPIDCILDAHLAIRNLPRPAPVADAVFLRRVYQDLVGLLPPVEVLDQFVQSTVPEKRADLIDRLLADDRAYAEHWLTFWNDLLRNAYVGTGYIDGGRKQISGWLYRALLENMPFDEFTRQLISPTEESEGFIHGFKWRGDVNASQKPELQFAQNVSQVFLGMNMKCASCHDSFIDPWTLEETYGLAAIYSREPLELHRCDKPMGKIAAAGWIYPQLGDVDPTAPQKERLEQLAGLIANDQNGRFARAIVNRLWHRLMGRGVIYPMEAMQTEPFSADLLDFLAADFVDHGYDLKHTLQLIANSAAYQSRSVSVGEDDLGERYVYAGPVVKRLTAEQFMDALWQLTGTGPEKPYKRAAQILPESDDRPFYRASLQVSDLLMRALGRPNREQVVTVRPKELTRLQAIQLFNSQILADILRDGAESLLERHADFNTDEMVEYVYRSAVSRSPSPAELTTAGDLLGTPPTTAGMQDLLWAVMMLPEFQLIR